MNGGPQFFQVPTNKSHGRCAWVFTDDADAYVSALNDPWGYSYFVYGGALTPGKPGAIHPVLYRLYDSADTGNYTTDGTTIVGVSIVDIVAANPGEGPGRDKILSASQGKGVQVMPTVASVNSGMTDAMTGLDVQKAALKAMLLDTSQGGLMDQHVEKLAMLAQQQVGGVPYGGLDLNYEQIDASLATNFTTFVQRYSMKMRAVGRSACVTVGGVAANAGASAYDYKGIANSASPPDVLHVEAYDFHGIYTDITGTSHKGGGPIAPLGWVYEIVNNIAATGNPSLFLLGLANYAVDFVGSPPHPYSTGFGYGQHTFSPDFTLAQLDFTKYQNHMKTCSLVPSGQDYSTNYRSGNLPHWALGRADELIVSQPDGMGGDWLFDYINLTPSPYFVQEPTCSIDQKVRLALFSGLGGVTYWTVGGEWPGFWLKLTYPL